MRIGLHPNVATKDGPCVAIQNALVAFMAGCPRAVVEHLRVVVYVLAAADNVQTDETGFSTLFIEVHHKIVTHQCPAQRYGIGRQTGVSTHFGE